MENHYSTEKVIFHREKKAEWKNSRLVLRANYFYSLITETTSFSSPFSDSTQQKTGLYEETFEIIPPTSFVLLFLMPFCHHRQPLKSLLFFFFFNFCSRCSKCYLFIFFIYFFRGWIGSECKHSNDADDDDDENEYEQRYEKITKFESRFCAAPLIFHLGYRYIIWLCHWQVSIKL